MIARSFEDTEYKKTCVPSLSGQRGKDTQNVKRFYGRGCCINLRSLSDLAAMISGDIMVASAIVSLGNMVWKTRRIFACK